MKERGILFSKVTGKPSQRGKRLRSADGLSWRERNRDAVNARRRALYAANPTRDLEKNRRYRAKHQEKVYAINAAWQREFYKRIRAEMVAAYGGACACCGEREILFLELDHIHGGGNAERRALKRTGGNFYKLLKKLGWPRDRYQLLCSNCNQGRRRNGGVCPHLAKRAEAS